MAGARPASYEKTPCVKSSPWCNQADQAFRANRKRMTKRLIVKSEDGEAVDDRGRARDFLSEGEGDWLLHGARQGRHGPRDYLFILMTYRHGLRMREAIGLRRS